MTSRGTGHRGGGQSQVETGCQVMMSQLSVMVGLMGLAGQETAE